MPITRVQTDADGWAVCAYALCGASYKPYSLTNFFCQPSCAAASRRARDRKPAPPAPERPRRQGVPLPRREPT